MHPKKIVPAGEYSTWKFAHHKKELGLINEGALFPPKNLQIDLEAWCPHDCSFCAYRNAGFNARGMEFLRPDWAPNAAFNQTGKPKGKIVPNISGVPKEVALNLPAQMAKEGIPSIEITGGGESLAYAWIVPFLEALGESNIQVAIVTNGQLLTERICSAIRNLKWIRFSMDAATKDTFAKIHGVKPGVWETTLNNIKIFLAQKPKGAVVGISYVISRENRKEIAQAASFWKQFGVDNIRYTFTYDDHYDSGLNPEELHAARLELAHAKKGETENFRVFTMTQRPDYYATPNIDFRFCGYQFFTWAIGYNAKVYPCCIQKYYNGFELGDLKEQSLHDIIYGERRRQYVNSFNVQKCKPCWLRDKNKFIEYLLEDNPSHINFT